MQTVVVIDYGMSNLRSVVKALEFVAAGTAKIVISTDPGSIANADRVVFPGQGAIGACMEQLHKRDLAASLRQAVQTKPFLGICLGLQTLMQHSEEDGGTEGLGIFTGQVKRFPMHHVDADTGMRLKVPHMGWSRVVQTEPHPLWQGVETDARFYFVHSYFVEPVDSSLAAGHTDYGLKFTSALARNFVFATQFHPEKSQRAGLTLLKNFLSWSGRTD